MIRCFNCGAETSNGLALCDLCQQYGRSCFEFMPIYFRNLARWRPGRAGSRPVPGSRVLYDGPTRSGDGTGDRISDTLDETMTALTTWARVLVKDRPHLTRPLTLVDAVLSDDMSVTTANRLTDNPGEAAALLCKGFDRYLTSIATTDWCGDFLREIGEHETRLRKMTEVAVPGWYGGMCGRDGCRTATYVVPGLTWVTCGGCGTTTHAADHLDVVLEEARAWVARPKALASALVALLDTEPSVPRLYDRIRRWAADDALTAHRRTTRGYAWDIEAERFDVTDEETGPAQYRLGDVLALILRETTRKAEIARNTAAAS